MLQNCDVNDLHEILTMHWHSGALETPSHTLGTQLLFRAVGLKICQSQKTAEVCQGMLEYLHSWDMVNIQCSTLFKFGLFWMKSDVLIRSNCNTRVLV